MTSSQTDRINAASNSVAYKAPCRVATTANITLSGEQTIDGIAAVTGNRVLVNTQTTTTENGIYVCDTGTWTRAPDADGSGDVVTGTTVRINLGTVNGGTWYYCSTTGTIVMGTSANAWTVTNQGTSLSIPLPLAQGGTAGTSAISGLSSLGVIQVTAEGGTANAQTGTVDALVTALRADQLFIHIPSVTNTGATTITYTPSGGAALAAKNVFSNGAACIGGELILGVPVILQFDGVQLNIIGQVRILAGDATKALHAVPLRDIPKAISGLTYSNNVIDAVNDLDIAVGCATDATSAYMLRLASAITKQSDVTWSVGTNAGGLDTGAVGNSDYYIWLIARSDTGVVDVLFSLSSTAPTTPTNYDFKRLIGWFKRVGGTIVAFHTHEIAGGGLEMNWDAPTLDVNLVNTLTSSRRTDAVKVPLNFSVSANLTVMLTDATPGVIALVYCPDETDVAPSISAAPGANMSAQVAGVHDVKNMVVRTSATGTIAARSDTATVDAYRVVTRGFSWARRN